MIEDNSPLENNYYFGITNLRLSNFKSIPESTDPQMIELAPLTLICGENSSGKSTLLHSILLMIQSITAKKETADELPLNGKLIKLNDFKNILHFRELPDMELGAYLDTIANYSMNIGIDFISPISKTSSIKSSQIKIDTTLSPELKIDERSGVSTEIMPFPKNEETTVKSTENSFFGEETNLELFFSTLPIKDSILVFDEKSGNQLKDGMNPNWNCKYQHSTVSEKAESKSEKHTYKGVKFNGGIPSKISRRMQLVEFLSSKALAQFKEILEDKEFVRDHLYDWLNNSFIMDGLSSVSRDDKKENEVSKKEFIDRLTYQFEKASEKKLSDLNLNLPDNTFTLYRNTAPWFGQRWREYYKNNVQLAEELIKCVNQNPVFEYSELFEFALYDLGMDLSVNEVIDFKQSQEQTVVIEDDLEEENIELDLEEVAEDLKSNVFIVFERLFYDSKFYVELENKLFNTFEKLFSSDNELFYVDLDLEQYDDEDLKANDLKANEVLSELREVADEIKYIGPLRMLENDEARFENFDSNIPMGLKGEYFFNYYEFTNSMQVHQPVFLGNQANAKFFDTYKDDFKDFEDISVKDKFNETLKYFEIAESFHTKYNPETDSVVGFIKPIGLNKVIKMTELGVGFSQLAPIILLCLTSKPGTTILLEQPELHLHPKVQQKFADFIIEMTEINKLQIILETHSDHMLNRIRRRIAQAKLENNDSSLFKTCKILFAEREEGVTQFRNANLTKSGTYELTDFPKGFFDQGAEDAFFIMKASLEDENGGR